MYYIHDVLERLLVNLETLHPFYCRQFDDPRIDTYYISIHPHYYMVLHGVCDECDSIAIYNNLNGTYDLRTKQGLEQFVNQEMNATDTLMFEWTLDTFHGNINELLVFVTNAVKHIVPL